VYHEGADGFEIFPPSYAGLKRIRSCFLASTASDRRQTEGRMGGNTDRRRNRLDLHLNTAIFLDNNV